MSKSNQDVPLLTLNCIFNPFLFYILSQYNDTDKHYSYLGKVHAKG